MIAVFVFGCAVSEAPTSAPPATPAPTATPLPTATPPPLTVTVVPSEEPMDVRTAVGGQRCIFLVRVMGGDPAQPIALEAVAVGGTVDVAPATIEETTVAEVTVIPDPVTTEANATVTITARRGDQARTETRTVPVWPETDTLQAEARDRLATFTAWLARERPELGITTTTAWQGTALQPKMLVVSHYLFLSDEWEVALEWHVMIAPHDWSRIILRRRWVEDRPSLAFEIASVSAGDEPHDIPPPDVVLR